MRLIGIFLWLGCLLLGTAASATIFGSLRGMVHDPQHRPVEGTMVMMRAKHADWAQTTTTDGNGQFRFNAVPLGEYTISVASPGFAQAAQAVVVNSGTEPVLHFQLKLAGSQQTVTVSAAAEAASTDSVTPTTLVNRSDVQKTPGASRTNSLAIITDYTPGAYITHDQLHIRGGHQVSWLIDGVPVPNSNIASNVGPQFDPKDIDYMEVERGSYSALFGDRTYGAFNVVPRTGFERNNQAELVTSFGNFYQTNDQFNFGGHTERFAYYASVNGNRSDLGLQTPTAQVVHDAENGYGGFGSLIFNVDPSNQLRLVTSLRRDYYQIPYDPNPNSAENQQFPSYGLRDGQHESDALVNFSWVHTFNSKSLLTVSPFYHFNSANYDGCAQRLSAKHRPMTGRRTTPAGKSRSVPTSQETICRLVSMDLEQRDNELFGADLQRRQRQPELPAAGVGLGQGVGVFCGRQIQSHALADPDGGDATDAFFGWSHGKCDQSAIRRGLGGTQAEMGVPRILRTLLPGAAAADGVGAVVAVRQQQQPGIHSPARRAG